MKVKQLVNLLNSMDPDLEVVFEFPFQPDPNITEESYWPVENVKSKLSELYNDIYIARESEEDKTYIKSQIKEVLVLS